MRINARNVVPWFGLAVLVAAVVWSLSLGTLPPADFTFWNESEISTVDPQLVQGVPDSRVAMALFEGLTTWNPKTLAAEPGVAAAWDISEDKTHFTFYLRDTAKWSDGTPLTAHDFYYSWRRLLDPITASKYVYQLSTYVKNGKKYNSSEVVVGERVEVVTKDSNDQSGSRGEVLHGKLEKIEKRGSGKTEFQICDVLVEGKPGPSVRYTTKEKFEEDGVEVCTQILPDFDLVGVKVRRLTTEQRDKINERLKDTKTADGNGVTIDQDAFDVTLEGPTPYFLFLAGFHTLSPVPRQAFEKYGYPQWTKEGKIVSNGAFILEARRVRDRIRMKKNPHYWNHAAVKLNTVDALSLDSDVTALNLYLTRKVDFIVNVPGTAAPVLLVEKHPDLILADEFSTAFYRFNTTKPPLDNPKVRKALALAVDRKAIISSVTRMNEVPAYSVVPPFIDNYTPSECERENVEKAQKLLAEAGFPGGRGIRKLSILCNKQVDHEKILELLQFLWRKNLGIECSLDVIEWSAYLAAQNDMKFDLCRAGWTGDYFDAFTFLGMFVTDGEDNNTGWSNKEYDDLIAKVKLEGDATKRREWMQAAERILMDEMPIVTFYYRKTKLMKRPYVSGIYPNLLDIHPLWAVSVDQEAKKRFLAGEGTP